MSVPQPAPPDFDRMARAYRWLEYLSFGKTLERTRFHFLDRGACDRCRSALVLGDGDGRFTARMMSRHGAMRVVAVDASRAMLALLEARCAPSAGRLTVQCDDVRTATFADGADLVVTHFVLDCLTLSEARQLVERVAASLGPGAIWLVSEFRASAWWSRVLVRTLYAAFRLLTGLRVTAIPPYAQALGACGFELVEEHTPLGGLLAAELWRRLPGGANVAGNRQPGENL